MAILKLVISIVIYDCYELRWLDNIRWTLRLAATFFLSSKYFIAKAQMYDKMICVYWLFDSSCNSSIALPAILWMTAILLFIFNKLDFYCTDLTHKICKAISAAFSCSVYYGADFNQYKRSNVVWECPIVHSTDDFRPTVTAIHVVIRSSSFATRVLIYFVSRCLDLYQSALPPSIIAWSWGHHGWS